MNRVCVLALLATYLIALSCKSSADSDSDVLCPAFSESYRFLIDEDMIYDQVLVGYVYRISTVKKVVQCHSLCRDDCRCVSINYIMNSESDNCELNEANQQLQPASLKTKPGARYYDLVRLYQTACGQIYSPDKHICKNQCCAPNPCQNGASCEEVCDPLKTRFRCACSAGFSGSRCEKKIPQSCKDHKEANGANSSGIYSIQDANGAKPFVVYCDFTSEPHFTWTLVQSYSYANNALFTAQHMSYDFPVNEASPQWNQYRLSRVNMQRIADQATYVRFTCNFESDGLVYTDYARAKLAAFHIFKMWYSECRLYERLNIRGVECQDCTAASYQRDGTMFHIGTYDTRNCQFNATVGAVSHEQSFGRYNFPNPNFRCLSTKMSTTQTWFGVRN